MEQGRAVLRDLAAHPATATHVATKLASYFIADTPPAPLVERMAKVFLDTSRRSQGGRQGDGLVRRILDAAAPPSSSGRASGSSAWCAPTGLTQADPARFTDGQALLGEPLWRPSSPKGFPDDEASWIDGMGRRLDVANNFAERIAGKVDPQDVIETVLRHLRYRPR